MKLIRFVSCSRLLCLWMGLASLLSGCASVHSRAEFSGFGEADPERDASVLEAFESERDEESSTDKAKVRVLLNTVPEGITIEGSSVKVDKGFKHEILGKFTLMPRLYPLLLWFNDYQDGWRKGLCYWQVPLSWVTLTLWVVVPTSYPCHPTPLRSKVSLIREVKTLARAASANGAMIGYIGARGQESIGAAGFLMRFDPRMDGGGLKTRPFKHGPDDTVELTPIDPERVAAIRKSLRAHGFSPASGPQPAARRSR